MLGSGCISHAMWYSDPLYSWERTADVSPPRLTAPGLRSLEVPVDEGFRRSVGLSKKVASSSVACWAITSGNPNTLPSLLQAMSNGDLEPERCTLVVVVDVGSAFGGGNGFLRIEGNRDFELLSHIGRQHDGLTIEGGEGAWSVMVPCQVMACERRQDACSAPIPKLSIVVQYDDDPRPALLWRVLLTPLTLIADVIALPIEAVWLAGAWANRV